MAPAADCRLRFAALALALAAAASAASGAASASAPPCRVEVGEETVQGRHHGPFSSLAVSDGIYAEAKLDSWRELNIFTYTSVAGRIRTEVVAGALNVSAEEGTCVTDTTVQISTLAPVDSASAFGGSGLVVEAVRGRVSASGGSNVSVGNLSSAANATLAAAGNGSEVRVGSLTVGGELRILVAGQARVSVLSGRAASVVVDASGPATVRLGGLLAGRLEVVAGGAHVELPSADAAVVSCGSGGRLRLAGRPRTVQVLRQDDCEIVRGGGADHVELVQVPTTTEAVEGATSTTPQAEATSTGPVSAAWAPHPALALPAAAVVLLSIR